MAGWRITCPSTRLMERTFWQTTPGEPLNNCVLMTVTAERQVCCLFQAREDGLARIHQLWPAQHWQLLWDMEGGRADPDRHSVVPVEWQPPAAELQQLLQLLHRFVHREQLPFHLIDSLLSHSTSLLLFHFPFLYLDRPLGSYLKLTAATPGFNRFCDVTDDSSLV